MRRRAAPNFRLDRISSSSLVRPTRHVRITPPRSLPFLLHARYYAYQSPSQQPISNPSHFYQPPPIPTTSYSSSGLPNSSHPMPEDMPREDYAAPAEYTFSMLGRILKYVVYGVVGVGIGTLVGVEGLHVYVENGPLAYPAHSPYLEISSSPESSSSSSINTTPTHIDPTSASYFAWEEDPSHPSYTGPSPTGGTSPSLGWRTRHALRSAWIALEWGVGTTGESVIAREPSGLHYGAGGAGGLKGMIGRGAAGNGNGMMGGGVNKVDTGYAIAEAYISTAIDLAQNKDGIEFPPYLSINRSEYPEGGRGVKGRPNRVAVDMLLRHAEVLERMGTSMTLHKASETYERVLRSLVETSTPQKSSLRTDLKDSASAIPLEQFSAELQQAERVRLVQKISNIHARMGDMTSAKGWSSWGVRDQIGMEGLGASSTNGNGSPLMNPEVVNDVEPVVVSGGSGGWFSGWGGNAGKQAVPNDMQHTLQANATAIPTQTPQSTASLLAKAPSPALLRATISLLSSHSTHLAISGELPSATVYQNLILDLIRSSSSTGLIIGQQQPTSPTGPEASLQRLWLNQREALTRMHLAEVMFAQGQLPEEILKMLSRSCTEGEEVIRELTSGRRARTQGQARDRVQEEELDLGTVEEIRSVPLASVFGGSSSTFKITQRPAQRLLRDAQRSSAENWSLLGLIHENLATSSIRTTESKHHLQETALDCYERAIGWSKVAYGGDFTGVQGGDSADEMDEMGDQGMSVGYQRSYERLRGQMEDGMKI